MGSKMWRTRVRSLLLNFILFGLGVMTCLICLQITSTSSGRGFDSSPFVLTHNNPQQEFLQQQSLQLLQQEYSNKPCREASVTNANSNSNNNNNVHSSASLNREGRTNKISESSYTYGDNLQLVAEGRRSGGRSLETNSERLVNVHNKHLLQTNSENNNINSNANNVNAGLTKTTVLLSSSAAGAGDSSATDSVIVYVVTPTYYRPEQKPELTRVAQALLPVSNFVHWIVIDDVSQGTEASLIDLKNFIRKFPLTYTLLKSLPPKSHTRIVGKPRGVGGRRAAIEWLRKNAHDGVVYFADDDNTYDSSIFRQMQRTKKVSMWPVGLVTDLGVSSPIVKNGKVVGFYDGWNGLRKFPVDMAGFAINMKLFHAKPKGNMPWVAGYEEDELLRTLEVTMQDIEPLANNCTEILVWHTKAVKNVWPKRPKNLKPPVATNTNLFKLLQSLPQKSLAGPASGQNKSEGGFSFLNWVFGGL